METSEISSMQKKKKKTFTNQKNPFILVWTPTNTTMYPMNCDLFYPSTQDAYFISDVFVQCMGSSLLLCLYIT
jgi:hypothetical protein